MLICHSRFIVDDASLFEQSSLYFVVQNKLIQQRFAKKYSYKNTVLTKIVFVFF